MLDNHEDCAVLREGATIGTYDRWQDVPATLFGEFPSAGSFIDDAGLNFYCPALMRWELFYGEPYDRASPAKELVRRFNVLRWTRPSQQATFERYRQYLRMRLERSWQK